MNIYNNIYLYIYLSIYIYIYTYIYIYMPGIAPQTPLSPMHRPGAYPHSGLQMFRSPQFWGITCPELHHIRSSGYLYGGKLTFDERSVVHRVVMHRTRKGFF